MTLAKRSLPHNCGGLGQPASHPLPKIRVGAVGFGPEGTGCKKQSPAQEAAHLLVSLLLGEPRPILYWLLLLPSMINVSPPANLLGLLPCGAKAQLGWLKAQG